MWFDYFSKLLGEKPEDLDEEDGDIQTVLTNLGI